MFNFTPRAQQVLALARKESILLHQNYIGTDHMLLGILRLGEGVAVNILQKMGLSLENVREEVAERAGPPSLTRSDKIPYTPGVKKGLALAERESRRLKHKYIGVEHILLGILVEKEGAAVRVLHGLNIDTEQVRSEIMKVFEDADSTSRDTGQGQPGGEPSSPEAAGIMAGGKKSGWRPFLEISAAFGILLVAALACYWTARRGGFLYDDTWLVGGNPFFKSPVFILEVFRHYLFLDSLSFYYRPVQNISYMFDYWLWYYDPLGYHLANIVYHFLVAFLLFLLLRTLLPSLAPADAWRQTGSGNNAPTTANNFLAFLIALIWVVHPIHNAGVAYISGRADSLACMFAIAAWLLYLAAGRSRAVWAKALLYPLAMFLFVLGLCSKEIAMVWLPLFLIHVLFFDREKAWTQKIAALLGVGVVMGFYTFLHNLPGHTPFPGGPGAPPFDRRLELMLRALGDYTWLIFYPDNLHMDRFVLPIGSPTSLFPANFHSRLEWLSLIGMGMIAVFIFMAVLKLPGRRLRLFSIVWFLSGFLPISNLFPLNAQVAEHWIYMPSMGILLFFAGCVLALPRVCYMPAAILALLAVAPLGIRTSKRAWEWASPERFFKQTIQSGGGSSRINLNLAMVYYNKGDYRSAEAMMRDIVKHFPDYVPARLDLGMTLIKEGKDKEAEPYLKFDNQSSADISKKFAKTWSAAVSIAGLQAKDQKYDDALATLDDAIQQYPGTWEVIQYKANVLRLMGRLPDAVACIQDYANKHWWHYQSFINLGELYRLENDAPDAIAAYEHAASLDIHASEPWFHIAEIDENLLRKHDAAEQARVTAVSRNPDLEKMLSDLDKQKDSIEAVHSAETRGGGDLLAPVGD